MTGTTASLIPLVALNPEQQYWWGCLGSFIIMAFKGFEYGLELKRDALWPDLSFRTCLLCGFWLVFPFVSGAVSLALEPHHRLIALFEGASAPALFFFVAKELPVLKGKQG
jgi:hypothetical protein